MKEELLLLPTRRSRRRRTKREKKEHRSNTVQFFLHFFFHLQTTHKRTQSFHSRVVAPFSPDHDAAVVEDVHDGVAGTEEKR